MRAELQARRLQRAKDLKDQAKAQLELDKEIKKKEEEKRLEIGKEQRAKEAAWQERREQQAQAFVMKGHKLVEETRQRQKNMDKAEDEQDKKERAEGLAEKKRILEAYKKEKAENYEENKVKVQSVKKATDPAIIAEASLSFLGLGQQPPAPSWGSMLNTAQRFLTQAPWMAIFPGLAIFLTVLAFNLFGDGLRDAMDPRR
jgi:flagellar motor protein MotB